MTSKRIIYFCSSRAIGLTGHLTDFAIAFKKDAKALFLSGETEQFNGLFSKLDSAQVNRATISNLDTSRNLPFHIAALRKIISNHSPDVIHSQTNYQLLLTSILKPFFKYKIIHTIHAFKNSKNGTAQLFTKLYINVMCSIFVDKTVFQTQFVENNFPKLKNKSFRLPMGFNPPSLHEPRKLTSPTVIIYAAKFHKNKNHLWLIDALGYTLKCNGWRLVLPGDGDDLGLIRSHVNKSGLCDFVSLPGWLSRSQIDKLYREAHLAVIPSASETLGHNIIEPLAYGIPIVSFPVGIAPDINEKTKAIICIPFYDQKALLEAINSILSDTRKYDKNSRAAIDYFMENLTWEKHIETYKKLLNEL